MYKFTVTFTEVTFESEALFLGLRENRRPLVGGAENGVRGNISFHHPGHGRHAAWEDVGELSRAI
jgi:hypothetical protein